MAEILIIDDDQDFCGMLDTFLAGKGHGVRCAFTLKGGFQEASANRYDVVFLDVYLPDGNGLDLLPRMREVSSQPEVIIFTGKGSPHGAELAIESGASMIETSHELSENPGLQYLRDVLAGAFPGVEVRFFRNTCPWEVI